MPASVNIVGTNPVQVKVTQTDIPAVKVGVAKQGPPGPPGDILSIVAGEFLGGHRVIASAGAEGIHADQTNSSAQRVVGLSTGSAAPGTLCLLKWTGLLVYPAGELIVNAPIFLGETGLITQVPPTTGWLRQVGIASDSSTISIDIGPAYWLGA